MTVTSTLESTAEAVDLGEEAVRRFTLEAGFDESDQYFIGLAAREILINAIKHGNGFDRNKKVTIRMSTTPESMTLEVSDEGEGFRLDTVPNPAEPENRERRSGRGLAIALAIMDEFFVDRNEPHGTHIRMSKRLQKS
jgi:serine/threonine-protein kinase RsbW